MLLSEPPPTQGDLKFALFGIPVRVHPFFWVVAVLLGPMSSDQPDVAIRVVIWVAALFIAILVHELGHATVMRVFGFRPWIVLYGMGGLASYDPADRRGRRMTTLRQILIHFAGPLAGFFLAAAVVGAVIALGYREKLRFDGWLRILPSVDFATRPRLEDFINDVLWICVFWGLINLLPIQPLDGGQIARDVLAVLNPRTGYRQSLVLSVFAAALLAGIGGLVWHDWYVALFFGYLAYSNYMVLQGDLGRGP